MVCSAPFVAVQLTRRPTLRAMLRLEALSPSRNPSESCMITPPNPARALGLVAAFASFVVRSGSGAAGPVDAEIPDFDPARAEMLNAYSEGSGPVFASAGGGCHVYPTPSMVLPPGMFLPPVSVACPPGMDAPEWQACTGPNMFMRDRSTGVCICVPGAGDPPTPAFAAPCPEIALEASGAQGSEP